ncbi:MAG TPA: hypothetical protein PKI92_02495 [Candidatus Woesebacteria bacterium]|nr:hypothetical protein [Candidatus Woesebacteria bacterium]HPR99539.1 hypothetical protein [Candidatus Woesebacteria bacterium]
MPLSLIDLKEDNYENKVQEYVNFYSNFFGVSIDKKPCLILVNKHSQFNELNSTETPDWLTGYTNFNLIFVLNPKKWETESSHKYSEEKFLATLKHEVCHIFYRKMTGGSNPTWLNEGLALFLADQLRFRKEVNKFKNFLKFERHNSIEGETVYEESGFAIQKLYNKFGKEKLLKFLTEIKNISKLEELPTKFENIYKMPLSYESFNHL